MAFDIRNIVSGHEIPSEGYCDQPYVVINADGSWTCVMTTGVGHEGAAGQHVVATISRDQGESWSEHYDIEPADGPEASWVMPLRVPETGRIYAFYTYNKENQRSVLREDGQSYSRVDSFGTYAYKYSDDCGRSWSAERYEIPMRLFACDRENAYGGKVLFFWGVGKPFIHAGSAYVCASKVGAFGEGFFAQNEGAMFASANLLTEHDPAKHVWETLPEGDIGLRTPPGGGRIAGEFNATPMNDGSLFGTYRTVDGFPCHAYSRDDGRTWSEPAYMTYGPGKRRVKNPRAANFVRRFSNGKYIYWFHNHNGGSYDHRNPVWMTGGVERDGVIHWAEPEILLYDEDPAVRMSYPDFIEQNGRYFCTETRKDIARVHEIDPTLLEGLWRQAENCECTRDGLLAEWTPGDSELPLPALPAFWKGGGLSLELRLCLHSLSPWQILFDSRDGAGRGMLLMTTDRGTLRLSIAGYTSRLPGGQFACGFTETAWECDQGLLVAGAEHHVAFIVDGGPKVITVLVDGVLCAGGAQRIYGWGWFEPNLKEANGAPSARIAPDCDAELKSLRVYGRALRTSEMVANCKSGK